MRKTKTLFKSLLAPENKSQSKRPSMNSDEIKHLRSLNESKWQRSVLHVTNPFASDVDALSRHSAPAETAKN